MVAQGLLGFQYASDSSSHGLTSLAGLPAFFDLIKAIGLGAAIRWHVRAAGGQGWLDIQMVLAVIFLNLAGGDCVDHGQTRHACRRTSGDDRKTEIVNVKAAQDRKIGHTSSRPEICSGIVEPLVA